MSTKRRLSKGDVDFAWVKQQPPHIHALAAWYEYARESETLIQRVNALRAAKLFSSNDGDLNIIKEHCTQHLGIISLQQIYLLVCCDEFPSKPFSQINREGGPLSRLIDVINERFGKDLNEADQLFFDQIVEEAVRVETLKQAAEANPIDKFQMVFRQVLQSLFIDRMDMNEELFANYMNEPEFREQVAEWLGQQVYHRLPKSVTYTENKPSIKRAKPRATTSKSANA